MRFRPFNRGFQIEGNLEDFRLMKTVLITTTIRVPKVLEAYRRIGPDVTFIIAGDKRTPNVELRQLTKRLGNSVYLSSQDQQRLGYKSSKIIRWNSVQRRNIALLEAIALRPDIIVSIDDDNIPLDRNYFQDFERTLGNEFNGSIVSSKLGWFNAGAFIGEGVVVRGFPIELRHADLGVRVKTASRVKIGVSAGLWLGDPDVDAIERISNRPVVNRISKTIRDGLAVDSSCIAPFDSQNTAILYELAPLWLMITDVGRYDDIWASFIVQRIMRESGYHLVFGKPVVKQVRNSHDPLNDLRDEMFGMEYSMRFHDALTGMDLGKGSILDKLFRLFELAGDLEYLPKSFQRLGLSWCDDIERVKP